MSITIKLPIPCVVLCVVLRKRRGVCHSWEVWCVCVVLGWRPPCPLAPIGVCQRPSAPVDTYLAQNTHHAPKQNPHDASKQKKTHTPHPNTITHQTSPNHNTPRFKMNKTHASQEQPPQDTHATPAQRTAHTHHIPTIMKHTQQQQQNGIMVKWKISVGKQYFLVVVGLVECWVLVFFVGVGSCWCKKTINPKNQKEKKKRKNQKIQHSKKN